MATVKANVTDDFYKKISKVAKRNRKTVSDFVLELVQDGLEIFEDVTDLADEKISDVVSKASKNTSSKKESSDTKKKASSKKKSSTKKK